MPTKVVFLHTVTALIGPFSDLAREILPADVQVWHVADEILAKVVVAQGGLSPFLYRRVADHAIAAEEAGASLVLLTCSSISPCTDTVQALVGIPVLKGDEPMVEQALGLGSRIGVAATVPTALHPVTDLVRSRAQQAGRQVKVSPLLCEGAYQALFSGHPEEHNRLVQAGLRRLMAESDVVLLAQGSMAQAVATMPEEERAVPILTSPRLAVERVREVISIQR